MKINLHKTVASAIVTTLAFAGCSNKGGDSDATGSDGRTRIVVDIWAGGEKDTETIKRQMEIAQKALSDIQIELRTAPWGGFFIKLTTNISTDSMAYVTDVNSGKLSNYKTGFAELAETGLATAGLKSSDFAPHATDIPSNDDTMCGPPFNMATMLTYYNADMINVTGAPQPKNGWTFNDFEAIATATTKNGKQGFGIGMDDFQWQALPIAKSGTRPATADGKLNIANSAFVEAFTWCASLITEKEVTLPVGSASNAGWGKDQFSNDNTAMAVSGTQNASSYLKNDAGFKISMTNLSAPAGGKATGLILGSGYGIAKSCKDKNAALKVLGALLNKEAQGHIASSGRSYPARVGSQPLYFNSIDERYRDVIKQAFEATFANVKAQHVSPNWSKVNSYIQPELVSVYNGSRPVSDVLNSTQKQFQQ